MITENEKNVLRMLFSAFGEHYSINRIAKECGLAPNGALKILRKFEKEGILKSEIIGNMKSYTLNFENEKTKNMLKLSLIRELKGRIRFRAEDLKPLKEVTRACIIFGSYIDLKKEPNDMDVFFIIKSRKFKEYKKEIAMISKTIPIKVHDILQTKEDVAKNIEKKDKVIMEIFKTGIILWGYNEVIDLIENTKI